MIKPHELQLRNIRDIKPSMQYDGTIPFEKWQDKAREKLNLLLGLPFEKIELNVQIEFDRQEEGFREIRFLVESERDYFVPCHLLIPHNFDKPLPVVICLQGHSTGMHISMGRNIYPGDDWFTSGEGDRDFAKQIIGQGYCALSIEQRGFGECGGTEKGPDCYKSSMAALLIGRTTIGERVWDVQRVIDAVETCFPQVDSTKIACMGHSGGGSTTYYAACIDTRIRAAMPSCCLCSYDDSIAKLDHCSCNFIPNIRKYFDMGDIGGLIAPRKLVIVNGKDDDIFPLAGVQKAYDVIQKIYTQIGAKDSCHFIVGNGGHRFYASESWPIFNKLWMAQV